MELEQIGSTLINNLEIEDTKRAVERLHNCMALFLEDVAIIEKFGQKIVWKGIVHVFKITGNAQTDTCYAWSSSIKGSKKRRYYIVLKIPPVDSPEKAIRAAIAQDFKNRGDQ